MKPKLATLKVTDMEKLTDTVYRLSLGVSESIEFMPGQYVNIEVKMGEWRSYSIANYDEGKREIMLLIDTAPGGVASKVFESIQIGHEFRSILPAGSFVLVDNARPKIFISTGTGVAPFLPMITKLISADFKDEIYLLFGIRYVEKDFVSKFVGDFESKKNFKFIRCITRPEGEGDWMVGRVTKVLFTLGLNLEKYDIYLCGAPQMVGDMVELLKEKGIKENVYFEKY